MSLHEIRTPGDGQPHRHELHLGSSLQGGMTGSWACHSNKRIESGSTADGRQDDTDSAMTLQGHHESSVEVRKGCL